jgi:fructokinase
MDVVGGRATPGGGPFNTARALARLGVPVAFLGHLSDDAHGRTLLEALRADGVALDLVSIGHEPTTLAVAHVDASGAARYEFDIEGTAAPALTAAMVPRRLPAGVVALHIGTLGLALEPIASTLLDLLAREGAGRVVMLDPNVRPGVVPDPVYRENLRRAIAMSTIVKASEEDLAWLGAPPEARLLVVTRGRRGAFAIHAGHRVDVPAVNVDVVDTIGAGDAFGAALLAWLFHHDRLTPDADLDHDGLTAALEYACLAAAITCTRRGADPPTQSDMTARTG